MPSHYPCHCVTCDQTEIRYRNARCCRACGGPVVRLETLESLAANRLDVAEAELRELRQALAELRRAFIARVPEAGRDGRL